MKQNDIHTEFNSEKNLYQDVGIIIIYNYNVMLPTNAQIFVSGTHVACYMLPALLAHIISYNRRSPYAFAVVVGDSLLFSALQL